MLQSDLRCFGLPMLIVAGLQGWTVAARADETVQIPDRPSGRELESPGYLPPQQPQEFELPPVEELQAPALAPAQELDVEGYAFDGNKVVATAALLEIAAPYAGRRVSVAELEELRQRLSRYYVDHGYINSGALLPADFYRGGIVHFQIVEGRVGEIRQKGMGRLRESYLRQRLIRADEPFNVNTLQERFQLLLADPLFAKVNARLQPGTEPGQASLDVDVTRARPWDLSVFVNNYQPPSIGSDVVGVTGVVRNLTGLGDAVDVTLQQGFERNGRGALGWVVPVVYRTDVHARYDHGESSVLEEPVSELGVGSILDSYELGVSHALIDSISHRFAFGLTYTHRENSTTLLGQPFPFVAGESTGTSKVDAWRFEQDFVQRWEKQAFALRSTFSWGWTNVNDTGASPDVPAKHYFFWLGQAQFTRELLRNGASVVLRGTLQWTQDRLVPLEQIAVGGVASVRGYRENQLVRDQGYYASLEFHYPLFNRPADRHRLSVVPFFDFGEAWNTGQPREQLSSIGLGFNWQFGGLFADLYYGHRLIEPKVESSGNLQDEGIHFQLRYEF